MIDHKVPNLQIYEVHYDHLVKFDGWDDYCKNHSKHQISKNHHLHCGGCGESHTFEHQFSTQCMRRVSYWHFDEETGRMGVRHKLQAHPKGHEPKYSVVIRDEFGQVYEPGYVAEKVAEYRLANHKQRHSYRAWDYWFNNSSNSPLNRGILPQFREVGWYRYNLLNRYKHYPFHYAYSSWYRHPKTMNEKRQYAAALVDLKEHNIRGRRHSNSLPNAWDDIHAHRDRTWKRAKVRKQWMVNLQQE